MPDAAKYDIKVLATDIDTNMLAAGLKGIYTEDDIASVPAKLRSQWFMPRAGGQPDSHHTNRGGCRGAARNRHFPAKLNFFGPWPMKVASR